MLPELPLAAVALDRAAHRRDASDLSGARALLVHDGALAGGPEGVVWVAPHERPADGVIIYLGLHDGEDLVAVLAPVAPEQPTVTLRILIEQVANGSAPERDLEAATVAIALANWHKNNQHCARCGHATAVSSGGWIRRCEHCSVEHYPRTDPAVIVAITDADDRLLLAHAAHWSAGRYSHLAGFVEPGETFEQAVYREVLEESGLRVLDVAYVGSQPWPFPASLMVAFTARVEDTALAVDGIEITDAAFFSRADLDRALANGSVIAPPAGSVAKRLLDAWYGREPRVGQA